MREISIYFHVPFCKYKCPYCHFYSLPLLDMEIFRKYFIALSWELLAWKEVLGDREVVSIYFGGGTPSVVPLELYSILLTILRRAFYLSPEAEITIEINPDTVDLSYLFGLRELGVNRLSLGVQTLSIFGLRVLGRDYSPEKVLGIIEGAKQVGFSNISVDLIVGYPFQSFSSLLSSITTLIKAGVSHLSLYELELEGGRMSSWPFPRDEEEIEALLLQASALIRSLGFRQYEVSNYAREGFESIHNLRYWLYEDWIGIGPSAAGKITLLDNRGRRTLRYEHRKNLKEYLDYFSSLRDPLREAETLSPLEETWERMIMGLRSIYGVNLAGIPERYIPRILLWAEPYLGKGELILSKGYLKPSPSILSLLHTYLLELEEILFQ